MGMTTAKQTTNKCCRDLSIPRPVVPQTTLQRRLREYYRKQTGPGLCGIASATMVINALHGEPRVTQQDMLGHMPKASKTGMNLKGISCLLEKYGCQTDIRSFGEKHTIKTLRDLLRRQRMEDDGTVTIANYWQPAMGVDRRMGHFSPLGGYDEENDTVLLLDVGYGAPPCDARYVSLVQLWTGLTTIDGQSERRGYVVVKKKSLLASEILKLK